MIQESVNTWNKIESVKNEHNHQQNQQQTHFKQVKLISFILHCIWHMNVSQTDQNKTTHWDNPNI